MGRGGEAGKEGGAGVETVRVTVVRDSRQCAGGWDGDACCSDWEGLWPSVGRVGSQEGRDPEGGWRTRGRVGRATPGERSHHESL